MAKRKKVESLDDAPVDVFEAVKRAFIRRGVVRGRRTKAKSKNPVAVSHMAQPNPLNPGEVEPADAPEKLVDLTVDAHDVLIEAQTVFPFTLFPDTLTIDREKLTIANRMFFKVAKISSVPIEDIQSIEANVGPFFGSLSILRINMNQAIPPLTIRFLWRDDVMKIQRLVQGYIIARQKKIDFATIEKEQLITLLNDLGQGVSD